ncbi:hypothetical protein HAX54_003406, partial [Datura stramonium]|nr:hypothetical protein [Datura stramonium]
MEPNLEYPMKPRNSESQLTNKAMAACNVTDAIFEGLPNHRKQAVFPSCFILEYMQRYHICMYSESFAFVSPMDWLYQAGIETPDFLGGERRKVTV